MKRLLAVSMMIVLLFAVVCPAFAVMPRHRYTQSVNASIDIDNARGIATCTGQVIANDDYPVELVLSIQVYKNGTWQTLKTWRATDTFSASLSKPYTVSKGYEYRAYAVAYIYDSNLTVLETVNAWDNEWYGDYIN